MARMKKHMLIIKAKGKSEGGEAKIKMYQMKESTQTHEILLIV